MSVPFRIFDLPTEIRLCIFGLVVTSPNEFVKPRVTIPRDGYYLRLPAITKASQRFRNESLPLYYERNIFVFSIDEILEAPLRQDLRYERRLLGFRSWCGAVGDENFMRMRMFVLSITNYSGIILSDDVHLLVRLGGPGTVDVTVHPYLWCVPELIYPECRTGPVCRQKGDLPLPLLQLVSESVRRNENRGLLPNDVEAVCRVTRDVHEDIKEARHGIDWRVMKSILPSMAT